MDQHSNRKAAQLRTGAFLQCNACPFSVPLDFSLKTQLQGMPLSKSSDCLAPLVPLQQGMHYGHMGISHMGMTMQVSFFHGMLMSVA